MSNTEILEDSLNHFKLAYEEQGRVIDTLVADKNSAYHERNQVVAALSKLFPSGITRTNIPNWDDEWHGAVYIDLPTGQISYHYHDSEHHLFAALPNYNGAWDGHNKDTVHQRLQALAEAKKWRGE